MFFKLLILNERARIINMNPPQLDPKYLRFIDTYTQCHKIANDLPPCSPGGSAFKIITSLINQPLLEGEQPWEMRACYVFYLSVVLVNVLNFDIKIQELTSPLMDFIPVGACNHEVYKVFIEKQLWALSTHFERLDMTECFKVLTDILGLLVNHCQAEISMHFNAIHSERMRRVYKVL